MLIMEIKSTITLAPDMKYKLMIDYEDLHLGIYGSDE